MRNTIIAGLSLLALLLPSRLFAQSRAEERRVKIAAFNTVEKYVDLCKVYDEGEYYDFLQLFRDTESPTIYAGDLMMGYDDNNVISPREYSSKILTSIESPSVNIHNIVIGKPEYYGGQWTVSVTLDKGVSYFTGDYFVSSREYYQNDFNMSLELVYDDISGKCLIEKVKGRIQTQRPAFPMKFWVIRQSRTPRYDAKLMSDGNGIAFLGNQAIVRAGSVSYRDKGDDIIIKLDTLEKGDRYRVVQYKYRPLNTRLIIHGGMSPMGHLAIKNSNFLKSQSNGCFDYGLDLGFTWGLGRSRRNKMGFFLGVGMASSNQDIIYGHPVNYTLASGVIDTNRPMPNINHDFKIAKVTESVKFNDIYVPVYFNFEHPLLRGSNRLNLTWNIGIKTYLNLSSQHSAQKVDGTLDDAPIGEFSSYAIPLERVHYMNAILEDKMTIGFLEKSHIDFSAIANIGLSVKCVGPLYFNVSAGYEYGLTPMFESKEYFSIMKQAKNNTVPQDTKLYFSALWNWNSDSPRPYTLREDGSIVAMSSFLRYASLYRQGLRVNVGLMLKL